VRDSMHLRDDSWGARESDAEADAALDRIEAEVERLRERNIAVVELLQENKAEVERLRIELSAMQKLFKGSADEVERLREAEEICLKYHNARAKVMQENERLRAALEFYADERLWYNGAAPKGPAIRDRGNRARNALAEERE
jgi:hypothetical protein